MHQNMINTNPIVQSFNGYMTNNPCTTPFMSNQLINENVHVTNNLNTFIQQQKQIQQQINSQQNQNQNQKDQIYKPSVQDRLDKSDKLNRSQNKNINIIEELMKPQIISKNNKDIKPNFTSRQTERKQKIDITNAPYKNIIRDKVVTKPVDKVTAEDIVVHTVTEADSNRKIFKSETTTKDTELKKINEEIGVEFHIDNYDKHKKKYDYKETFIRNLAYEAGTHSDNKNDYVEFYRKRQKEAEERSELCDKVLHELVDTGLIKPEELPVGYESGTVTTDKNDKNDIDEILKNINVPEISVSKTGRTKNKKSTVTEKKTPTKLPDKDSETQDIPSIKSSSRRYPKVSACGSSTSTCGSTSTSHRKRSTKIIDI